MYLSDKKNITTKLYEGVLFPVPKIIPDPNNTSKKSDSGEVWFDFNRLDLDDYAEYDGRINVRSAIGITEDMLYKSAQDHLYELYQTNDIQLSELRYITSTEFKRITIPYSVKI